MNIGKVMQMMIDYSAGNLYDVNHFLKVYALAKTIGEQEQIDAFQQECLELAAITHDIACPLCREKYGNTNGKAQEREGEPLARELLNKLGCDAELIDRVCFLVAHHHTYTAVDGPDYQILLEADYLVNADESDYASKSIVAARDKVFKTQTGICLLDSMFQLSEK